MRGSAIFDTLRQLLRHGVMDCLRDPSSARSYWRHMASAGHAHEARVATHPGSIVTASLESLVPEAIDVPVTLMEHRAEFGGVPPDELYTLCRIVRSVQPRTLFEIGTFKGATTLQLAVNTQARLHTLDLPPVGHPGHRTPLVGDPATDVFPERPGERFHGAAVAPRIEQLFGDSRTFDFTPYAGGIDVVFVDGCHEYESVVEDSRNALRMLAPSGLVIWHDYDDYAPGVQRALNALGREVTLSHVAGTTLVIHRRPS